MKKTTNARMLGAFQTTVFALLFLTHSEFCAKGQFVVSLNAEKTAYVLGEPVFITASIMYNGRNTVEVNNPLDVGPYRESIEVATGGSSTFDRFTTRAEYSEARRDRMNPMPRLRFEPGTNVIREFVIHRWYRGMAPKGNTNILVFAKPGEAAIRFTVAYDGRAFTNEVRIIITEPASDADREAWAWLQHRDRLEKFCELDYLPTDSTSKYGKEVRERMLKPLDDMLLNFRDSVYSKYMRRVAPERQLK